MINIEKMLAFEEGKKLYAYKDTKGILTCGIGHNLLSDPAIDVLGRKLKLNDKITEQECSRLFTKDLNRVYSSLPTWFNLLKDKYKPVVINMIFQMGLSGTLKFYSKSGKDFTINLMLKDNPRLVIEHIKGSQWYKDSHNRCNRMIKLIEDKEVKEYV